MNLVLFERWRGDEWREDDGKEAESWRSLEAEGSENGGRGGRQREGTEATTGANQRVQEGCGWGMRDGKKGW